MATTMVNSSYTMDLLGLDFSEAAPSASSDSPMLLDLEKVDDQRNEDQKNGLDLLAANPSNNVNIPSLAGLLEFDATETSPVVSASSSMSLHFEEEYHECRDVLGTKAAPDVAQPPQPNASPNEAAAAEGAKTSQHLSDDSESEQEEAEPTQKQMYTKKKQEDTRAFADW